MKAKSVGKGATLITLMSNPVVRRAAIRGANKAITVGSNKLAARSQKKASDAAPPPVEGQTTVVIPKRASFGETAAVESIVSSVASAAKPYVDKLAASDAGRSVLQVVNSVTGQALGGVESQPRRGGAAVAGFVGNIISGQGNSSSSKPEPKGPGSDVTFSQVKPPAATTDTPAPKTIQWPPPTASGSGS
ncbi:hypothetical protein BH23ACT12_BH23ACT12_16590 [soil metagenome]